MGNATFKLLARDHFRMKITNVKIARSCAPFRSLWHFESTLGELFAAFGTEPDDGGAAGQKRGRGRNGRDADAIVATSACRSHRAASTERENGERRAGREKPLEARQRWRKNGERASRVEFLSPPRTSKGRRSAAI